MFILKKQLEAKIQGCIEHKNWRTKSPVNYASNCFGFSIPQADDYGLIEIFFNKLS